MLERISHCQLNYVIHCLFICGPKEGRLGYWVFVSLSAFGWCLAAESVEGSALALQSVDNVHGGNRLALGVLAVGNGITDHVLQEDLQHASGLLVDQTYKNSVLISVYI
jgi:hypothetical protein